MIKFLRVIASLCLVLVICSCASTDINMSGEVEFTDSNGNVIKVNKSPKKVAVLFSSFAEIWTIAGGTVSVTVGETVERGFTTDNVELVDKGAGKTIDNELLLASKPDFVICSADIEAQVKTADILKEAEIPCALFCVESFEDYLKMLKICTDITCNVSAYEKYGVEIEKQINNILASNNATGKRILFVRSGSSASSAKAKNSDQNFVARMLEELGAYNIADNATVLLDGLSIEEILIENPDYIFISTMGDEDAARAYMNSVFKDSTWQSLTAIKENRYVYLPKDMFQFKPNARWGNAYQYLADILNYET